GIEMSLFRGFEGRSGIAGGLCALTGGLCLAAARTARAGRAAAARRSTAGGGSCSFVLERDFGRRTFDHRLRAGAIDDELFDCGGSRGDRGRRSSGNGCGLVDGGRIDLVGVPLETVAVVI